MLKILTWPLAILLLFMLASCQTPQLETTNNIKSYMTTSQLTPGVSSFTFKDWAGTDVPVWAYVPENVDVKRAPILLMMHGAKRNSERYLREWAPFAQEKGVVVIAPQFSTKAFPKSAGYNLGNVFKTGGDDLRDESLWTFSAIEPLFDYVVQTLSSEQTHYTLYGHSAGSQFIHRFLYYKPDARVKRYLAANAGWYTLPNNDALYPYGLKSAHVPEPSRRHALSADVVVLLGDRDTNTEHKSLRRAPEAMEQGPHRFARGIYFYENGKKEAQKLNIPFGWTLQTVPGVAHSNGGMARKAIEFVE